MGGEKTKFTVQVVHSVYGKTSYQSLLHKFENHCCVKWNGFMYTFGGWDISNEVCGMDLNRKIWKEVAKLSTGRHEWELLCTMAC